MTSYHFGKVITWYNDHPGYKQKHTRFLDGGVHTVVYNREMQWISSIYVDAKGRTFERVEYIDNNGEVINGMPYVIVDVYGNERDIGVLV